MILKILREIGCLLITLQAMIINDVVFAKTEERDTVV